MVLVAGFLPLKKNLEHENYCLKGSGMFTKKSCSLLTNLSSLCPLFHSVLSITTEQQDCYSTRPEVFREIRSVLLSTEEAYKAMLSDTRVILV